MLLSRQVYNYRFETLLSILLGKYPAVELLNHTVTLGLIFGADARLLT